MRQNTAINEVATLVAENNTVTQEFVKAAHRLLKGKNLSQLEQDVFGILTDGVGDKLPIKQIVDSVHMAEKHEAPLLQLADACAMIIRCCLEKKRGSAEFIEAFSQGRCDQLSLEIDEESPAGLKVLIFS